MNRCDSDKLTAYVDGALDDMDRRRMEEHLRECRACAALVADQRALKRAMAGLAAGIAVPPGLAHRVEAALDRVPPTYPPRGPWGRFGPPAGLAVLVTAAGLWFARPLWQPPPVDVPALMWHHRDALHPPAGRSLLTSDAGAAGRWLSARLPDAGAPPALSAPLRGVGVCRVGDAPAAVWMYRAERPVSLIEILDRQRLPDWSRAADASGPDGLREGEYGGYHALIWRNGDRTFALVSDLPPERLKSLLEACP